MGGISSVQGSSFYTDYGRFASGKKIQGAVDGAAELAIIEKQDAQIRGYKAGENNIGAAKDMLNIADGGMAGITDYLQKIRELGVQASNTAVMTDSDRAAIQKQIDQYKKGIEDLASQTSYNTKKLLDGSKDTYQIAADANGSGMSITMPDSTLQMLGIEDFDVTGDFDLGDIDRALATVSAGRSSIGAQTNALDYAYNYSTGTRLNLTASKSRLEDLDYPEAISEQKKKEVLQEYRLFMQKRLQDDEVVRMRNLFMH